MIRPECRTARVAVAHRGQQERHRRADPEAHRVQGEDREVSLLGVVLEGQSAEGRAEGRPGVERRLEVGQYAGTGRAATSPASSAWRAAASPHCAVA
ncbi:hypothetical protein [Streptomyces platensis]|uniref:hypothetical protein n=1 Tax=Streptomyces platensis TaxID=58346 RepID=UPI002E265325